MFCNKCGQQLAADAKFCNKCGAAVGGAESAQPQEAAAQPPAENPQPAAEAQPQVVTQPVSAPVASPAPAPKPKSYGKIIAISVVAFLALGVLGNIILEMAGITVSDRNLKGVWDCASSRNLLSERYSDKMEFGNGEYKFDLDGVRTSDKYRIKPSTYDREVWDSVKSAIELAYEITEDKPETFILETDKNGKINIVKIKTTEGEVIFVEASGSYVCKRA